MKFNLPLLFFILLVSAGCANQTTPTGGPEDTKPPILLSSDPEDREVNFQERQLHFDSTNI